METENFEPVREQKSNGSKSWKLFLFVILAIVLILATIIVMMTNRNPKAIFQKQIDKLLTYEETANHDTMKMNMDLDINVSGGEETNEIANLINDAKLSLNIEANNNTQEELYGIKLTKAEEELINAEAKLDAESEKAYINLGEFFNKTIEMDISELLDDVTDADTQSLNFMQLLNAKKAESILKKEVKGQLKEEYFSSEKTTINDENVTKNVLKMSGEELKNAMKNICQNLSENDEFISCFEDGDELKNMLKEIINEVEDSEISDDTYFEIDVYTKGIFSKIERVDFVMIEDEEKIAIQVTQTTREEYAYQLLEDNEKILEGTIKIQTKDAQTDIEVTAKAEEVTVVIKVANHIVYDEELSDFDMANVVKAEELSMEDMMVLYGSFMGSKLYDVIEEISGGVDLLSSSAQELSNSEEVNVLKTYNDETVKFNIPDGFEAYSSNSDSYRLFEKEVDDEQINVDVSIEYATMEEYMKSIEQTVEFFNSDSYSNVEISKAKDIQVNGKNFKTLTVSYDYRVLDDEAIQHTQTYYAYEIDDENLYTVEIEGANLMNQDELNKFLSIE